MCTAFCFIAKLHLRRFECKASILFTDSQVYLFIPLQVHIKMLLRTDVCLRPGDIVLDGNPLTQSPPIRCTAAHPQFSSRVYFGKTIAHLSYWLLLSNCHIPSDTFLARHHQIWPKSLKRHSGAERCLLLPELMRFQFLFESVQWSTDCCHAGLTADQRAKLRYVETLLHGRSRAFLGDRLYKSSAVGEMGDLGHNRHGQKGG